MPPKIKFAPETIVDIAFEHVRKKGWDGLSARNLAQKLGSSTGPIYTQFKSKAGLEEHIIEKAHELIFQYAVKKRTGDSWIDHGLGIVLFAIDEKHLWRAVNDEKHAGFRKKHGKKTWKALGNSLSGYLPFQNLSEKQVETIRQARWIFIHGYASLLNNSERPMINEDKIVHTIKRVSWAFYNEFIKNPVTADLSADNGNESNGYLI